jgi:hypothetical protein
MRFLHIREAKIDPELRKTFERYGTATMQAILAASTFFRHQGNASPVIFYEEPLLEWLTEEYDRADRKGTWSLTMEATITVFVVAELVFAVLAFFGIHR